MKKRVVSTILTASLALGLVACGTESQKTEVTQDTNEAAPSKASEDVVEATEASDDEAATTEEVSENTMGKELKGTQTAVIEGQDWGPAVTKTIIKLDEKVKADSVNADSFTVTETKESFNWAALAEGSDEDPTKHVEAEAPRTVADAYTSNADGEKTEDSEYITLELSYSPEEGSPFCYDVFKGNNTICAPYDLTVALSDSAALEDETGEKITSIDVDKAISFDSAIYPQLAKTDVTATFEGLSFTLNYASYEPEDDGAKHPLVIWLHGAGEGGNDPRLNTLGNEVTALYSDDFQKVMGGAYVLAPQCPTFWMQYDEAGNWMDNKGVDSVYKDDLKALIDDYVAAHENIDADRIIIGGCSNGGYMTMDMIMNYPDFFAAAYPICEAYSDAGITDEQLEAIKDLPLWFVYAENDTTVDPKMFEVPTLKRLDDLGANVHRSIFADVHDTSDTYKGQDGNAYQFMGHWSWIYFFNNECEDNGVNMWQWMFEQHR